MSATGITADLAYIRTAIVNVYLFGTPGDHRWVLVDAGMPGHAGSIARAAEDRFGGTPPAAIILTHGHFDHVGSLRALSARWGTPIYAHRRELPYGGSGLSAA
jgi:glyoxylase-like metal-dependent hydrolase (beta-lactamase superfamily II)